jgi:hypothetical protein
MAKIARVSRFGGYVAKSRRGRCYGDIRTGTQQRFSFGVSRKPLFFQPSTGKRKMPKTKVAVLAYRHLEADVVNVQEVEYRDTPYKYRTSKGMQYEKIRTYKHPRTGQWVSRFCHAMGLPAI